MDVRQLRSRHNDPTPTSTASPGGAVIASSPRTSPTKRKREREAPTLSAVGHHPRETRRTSTIGRSDDVHEVPPAPASHRPPSARATRSRPAGGQLIEAQPSAKALGKRRAVSPAPPTLHSESVDPLSSSPTKRRKTGASRAYNLRSRGYGADEPSTSTPASPSRPSLTMPRKSAAARSKAKALQLEAEDDIFSPAASTSHDAHLMDFDAPEPNEDDVDEEHVEDVDEGMDEEDDEGSDMSAGDDEDDMPDPPPTTDIHTGLSARKDAADPGAASRAAEEAANALAAAAAAAASEGDDAGFGSFAASLRAFPNFLAGLGNRFKELLAGLRNREDPNTRFVALTDLCELLAMSNEDTLAGPLRIDDFVKEFVAILKGNPGADGDAEMIDSGDMAFQEMILACRCLANLMEALPGSSHNVVHAGAVPILCAKLLEIQFIDLAEQTLITLEKISEDMPGHIVREGGLTAILTYLDFFATNVQRTAVTTAANCCRSLSPESFGMVRDIMPILRNVLTFSDQRVVEQACLASTRIVESYRHQADKLEVLLDSELLRAVCSLLVPSGGSVIGPTTYTQLLRMLGTATRTSPEVAISLLEMNVVDTLYHLLVGASAPSPGEEVVGVQRQREDDEMLVLTNLVHRPKDQVHETLTLVAELLPSLPKDGIFGHRPPSSKSSKVKVKREDQSPALDAPVAASSSSAAPVSRDASTSPVREGTVKGEPSPTIPELGGLAILGTNRAAALNKTRELQNKKRLDLLNGAAGDRRAALKRFYLLMLPTLVDVYAASVGVQVRSKALLGLCKVVHFCPEDDLQTAVKGVPLASFLANLLATRDQYTLVASGLQIVELLLTKLPDTYQFVFRREGVFYEVDRLADAEILTPSKDKSSKKSSRSTDAQVSPPATQDVEGDTLGAKSDFMVATGSGASNLTRAMRNLEQMANDAAASITLTPSPTGALSTPETQAKDAVTLRAKWVRDKVFTADSIPAKNAAAELNGIVQLIQRFSHIDDAEEANLVLPKVAALFMREDSSLTSFELLESGLLESLLRFLSQPSDSDLHISERQRLFFGIFSPSNGRSPTALGSLVKRLQESLSRIETFDVVTAFQSSSDEARRNSTSLLGRQLRITLKADGNEFPTKVRTIPVQVHAIATYQALHEYLKPRLLAALNEKPQESSSAPNMSSARDRLSGALAAFQAAASLASGSDGSAARLSASLSEMLGSSPPHNPFKADSVKPSPRNERPERRRSSRLSARSVPSGDPDTPAEASTSTQHDEPATDVHHDNRQETAEENIPVEEGIFEADFDPPEPVDDKPINVKMAEDGHKMEAATPDGTRVGTPVFRGPLGGQAPSPAPKPTASPMARPSYAAALKSDVGEWHLEFAIGEQDIPLDTTIYSSVHRYESTFGTPTSARTMWSNSYTVKYRKVMGPPSAIAQHGTPEPSTRDDGTLLAVPDSMVTGSKQAHILQLLRVLHTLNADIPAELSATSPSPVSALPELSFINNKLTAKMSRQLEEPMIVASSCLPDWALDLPQFYSFLFPFSTRHSFLQSTSFGYARLLARWANTSRSDPSAHRRDEGLGYLGRLTRQKVRISRQRMLESAVKVFELYAGGRASLEVEYFDEVGTGLGPTLEFYAIVSQEFQRKDLKLWRQGDHELSRPSAFIHHPLGLFPAPLDESDLGSESAKKSIGLFKTLGQFVAQGLMDSRILDLPFNRHFMRLMLDVDSAKPSMAFLRTVDTALASSLAQLQGYADSRASILANRALSSKGKETKLAHLTVNGSSIEDLSLDFTLPGYPTIELKEDGQNIAVEGHNVDEYIQLVIDYTLSRGIKTQLRAFREGFSSVFPVRDMRTFTPDELVLLFGNAEEDWSEDTLREALRADHGLSSDSRAIRFLIQIMSSYTLAQRRQFLQFITGSPKLPVGGFAALNPPLTVVRRGGANDVADTQLPSVMTCASYLKLPDYSTIDIMRERLGLAMKEGANSFHLS